MMTSTHSAKNVRGLSFGRMQALAIALGLLSLIGRAEAIDTSLINSSRWSGWHARGGTTDVAVTVIDKFPAVEMQLFAKGINDRGIYTAAAAPGTTTVVWQRIGYGTTSQPISGVDAYDGLYAAARGDDGFAYIARRDRSSGVWSAFTRIPGSPVTNSALAITDDGTRLYVFAQRNDNQIVYASMLFNTRVWDAWRVIGGTTNVAVGVVNTGNNLYLVAKGINDRQIYLNSFAIYGARVWTGWRLVPGLVTSKPVAITSYDGGVALVAVSDNGTMYLNRLNPSTLAGGWIAIPNGVTSAAASVATDVAGNLIVMHRGNDSAEYENILQRALDIEREISLPASSGWVDSGFDIYSGANLAVTTVGSWSNAGPATISADGVSGYKLATTIAPNANLAALVGRIGNGAIFQVGSKFMAPVAGSGRLYLRMNDVEGTYGDNQGTLTVTVASNTSVTVRVNAVDGWTNTRVFMKAGSNFHGEAKGLWNVQCLTYGSCQSTLSADGYVGSKRTNTVLPSANLGSLIGAINGSFAMGKSFSGYFPTQSPLLLSMNDVVGTFGDNAGYMMVTIVPGGIIL